MSHAAAPRIAVAGMAIESSSYAAHRAGYRDFAVTEGAAVVDRYEFLSPARPLGDAAEWIGIFYARSIPGGRVRREVYVDFRGRILEGLAAVGPVDGLYLDVHGAMSVEGMDDAEGDLVEAIRGVIGPTPIISAPMDLHGNVSERFARAVDLPTAYRLAPHEDAWETRERAARNLLHWLGRGGRPRRAWVRVPILLPGEKTSTRVEPARGLYSGLAEVEQQPGVTDASIWIGYAWADEPRCHASVLVSGADDEAIARHASTLARRLWDARDEFTFVGPTGTLAEGIEAGLAHRAAGGARPYVVSDSGDNPGAGGTGDVTWALTELLAMPALKHAGSPVVHVASIFDGPAIEELFARRPGEAVAVVAGAWVDDRVCGPVRIEGELVSLHEGDPDAGRIAVVRCGGILAVLTEHRKAFHDTADFRAIGLEPTEADIVVTKIGYLEPTLHDIARGWTLALTPGPVDQDLERLGHSRILRPMHPFDPFPEPPDFSVHLF